MVVTFHQVSNRLVSSDFWWKLVLCDVGAPATVEQAARLLAERGVQVSVAAARRVPALHALYEHAGGELHQAQQRNYAKVWFSDVDI